MAAPPPAPSVPHHQWELHLKDVHGLLDSLTHKVSKLEQGGPHVGAQLARHIAATAKTHERHWPQSAELASQVVELHRICREELATKQALAAAASRLDLDVVTRRREVESDLDDVRGFVRSEVGALRAEMRSEFDQLRGELSAARQETSRLEAALRAAAVANEVTYVTKTSHEDDCSRLQLEREASCRELMQVAEQLRAEKASRQELSDTHAALRAHHEGLSDDHGQTAQKLQRTVEDLQELLRRSYEELATQESVRSVQKAVAGTQQQLDMAAHSRKALRADLDADHSRLEETILQQNGHFRQLSDWMAKHSELRRDVSVLGGALGAQLDRLDQRHKTLDRREKSSWDQFRNDRQ